MEVTLVRIESKPTKRKPMDRITGLVRISVVRQFINMQITMRQLWEQCEVIFLPIYNDLDYPMIVSFDDIKDLVLSRN